MQDRHRGSTTEGLHWYRAEGAQDREDSAVGTWISVMNSSVALIRWPSEGVHFDDSLTDLTVDLYCDAQERRPRLHVSVLVATVEQ